MQLILFDVTEKTAIYSIDISDNNLDLNKKKFIKELKITFEKFLSKYYKTS